MMARKFRWLPMLAGLVASTTWATEKPVAIKCEPSRACAIELAREAGRQNFKARGEVHEYAMALLAIGDLQLEAGDTGGFAATVTEFLKAVRPDDKIGYRGNLAALQAHAGQVNDALATVRSMRDPKERNDGYTGIANALASQGKWREALPIAKLKPREKNDWPAEADVMRVLANTGRREWVQDAAPTLAPKDEALWLAQVEIEAGNLAAARGQALRITNIEQRLTLIERVGSKAEEKQNWDELATIARLIPPDAARVDEKFWSGIHYEIAAEWLIKAGAFDDAQALIPKLDADERERTLAEIAHGRARSGDYRKAAAMLGSIHHDFQDGVRAAIATGKVLAGDAQLEAAMATIEDRDRRMDSLEFLGTELPDTRREEARNALRQAVQLAQGPYVADRAIVLGQFASLQASRGFFDDALQTALLVKNTEELLGAYGDIGVAQASKGLTDEARKTFLIAEAQARKYGFSGEDHAWLIESLANAGLLPEAFAQVQALCRRAPGEYWFNQSLDPAIVKHVEAGQLPRAFEIASMLSGHDSGDPHYFLTLANALSTNQPP